MIELQLTAAERDDIRRVSHAAALKASPWPERRCIILGAGAATASDGYRAAQATVPALAALGASRAILPAAGLARALNTPGRRADVRLILTGLTVCTTGRVVADGEAVAEVSVGDALLPYGAMQAHAAWSCELPVWLAAERAVADGSPHSWEVSRADLLAAATEAKPFGIYQLGPSWVNPRFLEQAARSAPGKQVRVVGHPPGPVMVEAGGYRALIAQRAAPTVTADEEGLAA